MRVSLQMLLDRIVCVPAPLLLAYLLRMAKCGNLVLKLLGRLHLRVFFELSIVAISTRTISSTS